MLFENLNILRNVWNKFVKQKAINGEGIRHCSGCLENAVMSILHNVEYTFLKSCKNRYSFTYIVVAAQTACMEDKKVLKFCVW
jgi:hypothetical protein